MKRTICFIIAIILILAPAGAFAQDDAFYSETFKESGIIIYEAKSDSMIYQHNSSELYSPGSITKLLTCLVLLDNMGMDEKITATSEMLGLVEPNSSLSGIVADENLTVGQLVYAMLLPSGNDASKVAAVGCGRKILGDENSSVEDAYAAFIAEMNKKASTLGMTNSNFTNSDGYDDPESYSTAEDILKLSVASYENDVIREVTAKTQRYIETNRRTHNWKTTNMLIYEKDPDTNEKNPYYDSRVKGLKTGFTDIDGRCFALVADDGEMVIYGIYLGMGFTSSTMWNYINNTVKIAYESYYTLDLTKDLPERYTFEIKNDSIFSDDTITLVPAENQENDVLLMDIQDKPYYVSFMVGNDETATVTRGKNGEIMPQIKLEKSVKEGDVVSYMLIFDAEGNAEIGRMAYVATKNVGRYGFFDFVFRVVVPVTAGVVAVAAIKKLKDKNDKIKLQNGRKTA